MRDTSAACAKIPGETVSSVRESRRDWSRVKRATVSRQKEGRFIGATSIKMAGKLLPSEETRGWNARNHAAYVKRWTIILISVDAAFPAKRIEY